MSQAPIRQAVVLVGGLGTRLGALTKETPKPLLPVGGRPFLHYLIEEVLRHGVQEILLLAGFRAEKLSEISALYPQVRLIVESSPLGTGGALRNAAEFLDERFFFLNGDSLFDVNLWDLASISSGATATLALRKVPDVSRYGPVALEGEVVTAFGESTGAVGEGVINGGVAVLSRDVLADFPQAEQVSIERDVYPRLASEGRMKGRAYDRPFIDIGVPDDFERSQAYIPALVRRGAVIFDRDGVINAEVNYAHRPDQIEWVPGALDAIKAVNDAGLYAFVATNQAGVAHGYYGEADVTALHDWMNAQFQARGAHIDAFAYSPYHPEGAVEAYRKLTECRKPGAGMLLKLMDAFGVDRERTIFVGDRETDMAAARAAGVEGVLFTDGDLGEALALAIARLSARG
ncbi:HAD-IIIA family hydrolase [Caulobacter endophyticus]|uniref:D,D-heptose 1,7-bisphosphate phosphatase n=1 Tax=Caulobacter endophyticus TaxID=2172652 RepID=A0A2T9JZJ9_9CAUL|nr:HAD-IIIA family hydrolase [Caulobacter endophyticus]PVM89162.1 mannose-1-phosphate guanyltransferase [Caulobacter endophyticus]